MAKKLPLASFLPPEHRFLLPSLCLDLLFFPLLEHICCLYYAIYCLAVCDACDFLQQLVVKAVSLAIARDGASGGVVRTVTVCC
jgi:hypothetical protein